MLHTFHAPEPSSSGEEEFCKYISFLSTRPPPQGQFGPKGHYLNNKTPAAGPFWAQWPLFEQTWLRSVRQCYIPNIKAQGLAVSEEMSFEVIVDDGRYSTHDGRRTLADANSSP